MPKVSIIIPTYNRANLLKLAIESVLNQSFQDFEIIVCDNASVDCTRLEVEKFHDVRIKYFFNKKNIGVVRNHNFAIEKCNGEYLHFFSDDDIMKENSLEIKVKELEKNKKAVLIHTNINIIDSIGNISSNQHWAYQWEFSSSVLIDNRPIEGKIVLDYLLNFWNFISLPTVMVRMDVIKKSNLLSTELNLYCDYGFWCELANYGQFIYLEEKTVDYRFHSSNTIYQSSFKQGFRELQLIKKKNLGNLYYYNNYFKLKNQSKGQLEFFKIEHKESLLGMLRRKVKLFINGLVNRLRDT
jgi:glycosyltransferase involved in cell wall biosynthesis